MTLKSLDHHHDITRVLISTTWLGAGQRTIIVSLLWLVISMFHPALPRLLAVSFEIAALDVPWSGATVRTASFPSPPEASHPVRATTNK